MSPAPLCVVSPLPVLRSTAIEWQLLFPGEWKTFFFGAGDICSISCYKNTQRAIPHLEIVYISPEITWRTLTLFVQRPLCRTDLWHWISHRSGKRPRAPDYFGSSRDGSTECSCPVLLSEICPFATEGSGSKTKRTWSYRSKKSTFEADQPEDSHSALVRLVSYATFVW